MLTVTRTVRIEWGDCDPAGIVYFPRYFEYFDQLHGGASSKPWATASPSS